MLPNEFTIIAGNGELAFPFEQKRAIWMRRYVVISIPASWMIDTYGIRVAVGIGAVLTGMFGTPSNSSLPP